MNNVVLILAVSVLLVILLILFVRVQGMLGILKGDADNKDNFTNRLNAGLFLAFLIIGTFAFFYYSMTMDYELPEASSVHGLVTDNLFWITTVIITIAFVLTHILLMGFAFKYRYSTTRKATFYPENHKLELIWTVVPAIVLAILIFSGAQAWNKITTVPDRANDKDRVELEIVGQQFQWKARYPGKDGRLGKHNFRLIDDVNYFGLDLSDKNTWDDFTPLEIHLPVNKNVLFRIRSKDVLHSVYAPHFRIKMDAVPGMPTQIYFKPTKTTKQMRAELGNDKFEYEVACAEMCGKSHFNMRYSIVVETEEEYNKWLTEQENWALSNKDYVTQTLSTNKELSTSFGQLYPSEEEVVAPVAEEELVSDTLSTEQVAE